MWLKVERYIEREKACQILMWGGDLVINTDWFSALIEKCKFKSVKMLRVTATGYFQNLRKNEHGK